MAQGYVTPIVSGIPSIGTSTDRAIATWNGTSGNALYNNSTVQIDSTGRYTNTVQPGFFAYLGSNVTNATGNGATWKLGTTTALTIDFDNNSNMTTGGTFTAPVTGVYALGATFYVTNAGTGGATSSLLAQIITTAKTYYSNTSSTGAIDSGINIQIITKLTATNTVTFNIQGYNYGGNTLTILGQSGPATFCYGYLLG